MNEPTELNNQQESKRHQGTKRNVVRVTMLLTLVGVVAVTLFLRRSDDEALLAQGRRPTPGFDLEKISIPRNEIRSGGPPKDGIPALTNPKFITIQQANYLTDNDQVIGVVIDGTARAYPLKILNYHEVVNDQLSEIAIAVTYCPLCDSSIVFDRRTPQGVREFGVSGLLYNSNVLMYDRSESESLWSQLKSAGISGAGMDAGLKVLPFQVTTWKDWKNQHSDTVVLSTETGHPVNYAASPYQSYFQTDSLMFPVKPHDTRLKNKVKVLGLWNKNAAIAIPFNQFANESATEKIELDGKSVTVQFDKEHQSLRVLQADDGIQWVYSFWFAWSAFYPQTQIWNKTD